MIGVIKPDEPDTHVVLRERHLSRLRRLTVRSSKDIHGYDSEKILLWRAQYGKCCYCEQKISCPYNDVEHYRPKAEAQRSPGCVETHGYWWLAYSWENLFYACPSCNRSSKNSSFPLAVGSTILEEDGVPPGNEIPLLAYPGSNEVVLHIEFKFVFVSDFPELSWWEAVPVDSSEIGRFTIDTIGLNTQDRREVRMNYCKDTLKPLSRKLNSAMLYGQIDSERNYLCDFIDLFRANQPFSVFAFSFFRHNFPGGLDRMIQFNCGFAREMLGCTLDINYGV